MILLFTDFADEMPITEMKQKLIERFLRKTFIPSSTYGQLVANMSVYHALYYSTFWILIDY